jgi:hypothetical protein
VSRTDRTNRERSWPRCPVCGTRRRTLQQLIGHADHTPCTCGGYHYPHRPGSPYCDQGPESGVLRALRDGWAPTADELLDAQIDATFTTQGRPLKRWPEQI